MPTKIDIASNALLLIGDNPINSFTEPGFGATAAANLYETTYKSMLGSNNWSFAYKEQELSKLTGEPDQRTGFRYIYQLPTDMIRLWEPFNHADFDIVGDKLYSNLSSVFLRYIHRVDETSLPEYFIEALEFRLASKFAKLVTDNDQLSTEYRIAYERQVASAMSTDAQGNISQQIVDSPFVDVRNGGL